MDRQIRQAIVDNEAFITDADVEILFEFPST